MALKKRRPTSPGSRFVVTVTHEHLHRGEPFFPLLEKKAKFGGRNSFGRICVRHQGGGAKQKYRLVDFKRRDKNGMAGLIERIEYDPNRSSHIALVCFIDGERRYIVATEKMRAGQEVFSGPESAIADGNTLPLRNIPVGSVVCCVEMRPGKGAQLARSAGTSVQLLAKEGPDATLRLRSGEMRKVSLDCWATMGVVSNGEHNLRSLGKAGAKRWRGIRPTVRGVAMNPVDHPLGGGEGKTSGGRPPCTPWGKPEGRKTRHNKRTDRFIVRNRHRAKKD